MFFHHFPKKHFYAGVYAGFCKRGILVCSMKSYSENGVCFFFCIILSSLNLIVCVNCLISGTFYLFFFITFSAASAGRALCKYVCGRNQPGQIGEISDAMLCNDRLHAGRMVAREQSTIMKAYATMPAVYA